MFWLVSIDIKINECVWCYLLWDWWFVYFNIVFNGIMFVGDGGDNEMVVCVKDGKWIYFFELEFVCDVVGISVFDVVVLIKFVVLKVKKLVNMENYDYRLEFNVIFIFDSKWVVFCFNMYGLVYVYVVEVVLVKKY